MPSQPSSWLHASGYRFLLRRIECALLGMELRAVNGPLRAQAKSLACGCALTLVAVVVCVFLALLRPQVGLGDARIVMGKTTGALYVRVGDTWHPVLNLASARLIAAVDANPTPVPESVLAAVKHGALLGIPGAPQMLAPPLAPNESNWTICDSGNGVATTVFVGPVAGSSVRRLEPDRAVLAATGPDSPAYLLYRGSRAVVDLADPVVLRAAGLADQVPHAVSSALLSAVPEAPPIAVPHIRGAGGPAGAWLPGFAVGSVLRITRASGDEHYVVLAAGLQRIGRFTADLLRFSDSQGAAGVIAVAPDAIRAAPLVDTLPVSSFPDETPTIVSGDTTVCAAWQPAESGRANITLLTGGALPPGLPVALAQADGAGSAVDAFWIPPGRSAYVAAQSLGGRGPATGTRYLVTDTGVRFAIHDNDDARLLGLPMTAAPAPWPLLAVLPGGPELSKVKASTARDVIGAGTS